MTRQNNKGLVAVFDVDNTLIDSGMKLKNDVVGAFSRLGMEIGVDDVVGDWFALAESYGFDREEFDNALGNRKSWEESLRDGEAPLFDDVYECLDQLQGAGVALGVLTRSIPKYTRTKLNYHGLEKYFGDRMAVTPVQVKRGKEQEAIQLIQQVGPEIVERAYFIGDKVEDVVVDNVVHREFWIQTHGVYVDRKGRGSPKEIDEVKHPYERYKVASLSEVPGIVLEGVEDGR